MIRSPRKLLRAVVARLLGGSPKESEKERLRGSAPIRPRLERTRWHGRLRHNVRHRRKLLEAMGSYPGGADKAELKGGLLTFTLEQFKEWAETESANEIMSRVAACLTSIAQNEANTFAPGAKSFRIAIVYQDDLPEEVERAFEKLRETASANYGVEITWGRLHPDGA